MKKFMILTAALFAFSAAPALAGHHDEGGKGKKFEKHDTNGDGELSRAERRSAKEARKESVMQQLDTNGDGEVSDAERAGFDEVKAERKERRGERGHKRGRGRDGEGREGGGRRGGRE